MTSQEKKPEYILKNLEEINNLRISGKLSGALLDYLCSSTQIGMTTDELNTLANKWIEQNTDGGCSAFLGYKNFPESICVSINNESVHGIPGNRIIENGDIVSIDVGVLKNGWYGDTARTIVVGKVTAKKQRLLDVGLEGLNNAIKLCDRHHTIGDLSSAMQMTTEVAGYNVIREYGGHGIGRNLHEPPFIACWGHCNTGLPIIPGMVLAIEIMVNAGTAGITHRNDGTVITKDGSLAVHFEHTVAVLEDRTEILTQIK